MLWFRRPDALVPTLSLLGYLLLAYPLALYGLSQPLWFACSVLLLANALVLSAFLLHHCLPALIFCYHNVHHQKPSESWYRLPAGADGVSFLVGV